MITKGNYFSRLQKRIVGFTCILLCFRQIKNLYEILLSFPEKFYITIYYLEDNFSKNKKDYRSIKVSKFEIYYS